MPSANGSLLERSRSDAGSNRRPVLAAVGPDGGSGTLRAARAIALRESRPLLVLSVVEPSSFFAFDVEPVMAVPWTIDEQLSTRRQLVRDRIRDLAPAPFGDDEPEVLIAYGDPTRLIHSIARTRHAHLVVMGTGPHGLPNRVFATETTLGVIRRAPCPVLAVGRAAIPTVRTVVIALDFSPASLHAARHALPLLPDGTVAHLVHVWRRSRSVLPDLTPDEFDDAYERALPARFARARDVLGREHSLIFVSTTREGDPVEALLAEARAVDADLIVAGAHGMSAFERLLVGSVSTGLLRGASCSVLVAPEPPALERARLERLISGTSTARAASDWADELESFARRNRRRRTALEIDDESIGAQVQELGVSLLGASYDHRDHHVSLMFGDPSHPVVHLTRSIPKVRSVSVARGMGDEDAALCIESDAGMTLLTFLDARTR